jgi:serine/threonine protein kinase
MLKHPPTSSSDSAGQAGPLACARQRRLEAAAAELVRRLETGERMDVALLALEYPDLMPELGQRLHDLRRLRRAEEQARLRSGRMPPHDPRQAFLEEELETLRQALDAYEVLERVQYGGQGIVYRARQRSTNRIAALKLLLDGPLASERARHRFEREIELVSRLRHPNIITVYESGVVRGRHYYAMEFVAGLPIDDYVILHDLPPCGVVPLIVKVCRAVHHAHQNGVIHRDLNPANILVDEQGEPRVYDFGLAKDLWADRAEAGVSFTGAGAGTLPYLSPEQAGGQDGHVDVRSDVYSIGLVLYELLTDMLPYPVRGDAAAVQAAILHTEPMPLRRAVALGGRERAPGLDTINVDLERVLANALAKAKEERYQTAADFADDLERWLGGDAVVARADSRLYVLRKALRRHRLAVSVAATILAALAVSSVTVTVAWLRVRQGRDRAREAARVAYDLFDMALTDVEESVQPLAGGVAVRDRLIQRLSRKMPQLEALTGSDTALDPVLTRLLEKQGDIAAQQGQREAAKHYYGAFLDNCEGRLKSAAPGGLPAVG